MQCAYPLLHIMYLPLCAALALYLKWADFESDSCTPTCLPNVHMLFWTAIGAACSSCSHKHASIMVASACIASSCILKCNLSATVLLGYSASRQLAPEPPQLMRVSVPCRICCLWICGGPLPCKFLHGGNSAHQHGQHLCHSASCGMLPGARLTSSWSLFTR